MSTIQKYKTWSIHVLMFGYPFVPLKKLSGSETGLDRSSYNIAMFRSQATLPTFY